ncbi:MAG: rRNA maturation RNase YbeY [bacterium]|nr:rRNA maturation RNase YbeY [bacterium]
MTRGPVPRLPFDVIARKALGPHYELSLVICGDHLARRMNREHREKNYKPNVLSFPLGKHEGEIFLNVHCAEREAHKFGVSVRSHLALLFVHGCFHLKGLNHGKKMEHEEQAMLKKFGFKHS